MQSINSIMKLCRILYIMLFYPSECVHVHFHICDSQPAREIGREGFILSIHQRWILRNGELSCLLKCT